jgi:hypothetical protein
MAGGHFVGVARPLVVQTMTKAAEKTLAEEYRNTLLLLKKHREFLERRGHYEFCLQWVHAKQSWLEHRHGEFLKLMLRLILRHPGLTVSRLVLALPNAGLNRAIGRFHSRIGL